MYSWPWPARPSGREVGFAGGYQLVEERRLTGRHLRVGDDREEVATTKAAGGPAPGPDLVGSPLGHS
jgi:hypothetical protein